MTGRANPFTGWTEQCFNAPARDATGMFRRAGDPRAVSWCADGWLQRQGVSRWRRWRFSRWLKRRTGHGIIPVNDLTRMEPEIFRRLWKDYASR